MIFHFLMLYGSEFKIKLAGEPKFLTINPLEEDSATLGEYENATILEIPENRTYPKNRNVMAKKDGNKMLIFNIQKQKLEFVASISTPGQTLNFVPIDFSKKTFWIINSDKCITWNEDKKIFISESCYDEHKNQLFEFLPEDPNNNKKNEDPANGDGNGSDKSSKTLVSRSLNASSTGSSISSFSQKSYLHSSSGESRSINSRSSLIQSFEKENLTILMTVHKLLYDILLCFGNRGICKEADKQYVYSKGSSSSSSMSKGYSASVGSGSASVTFI